MTDKEMTEETAAPTNKARIAELEKELVRHRKLYAMGKQEITDPAFDVLEDELRQLDPRNPVLHRLTAPIDKGDHKLPVPLPSLNKMRPDRNADWPDKHPGPYVVSDKLDGLAGEIVYVPGKPTKMYTSSDDGLTGKDISHLLPVMNVPQTLPKAMIVRVELIMNRADFATHWAEEYKNTRNLSVGIKNKTSGIHKAAKHFKAVALGVLSPRGQPSAQLTQLKTMGFDVVAYKVYETISIAQLSALFAKRKVNSPYDVDGLSVEQDIKTSAPTDNPKHHVAFKDMVSIDSANVKVKEVTWQESRYGKFTPLAWFDPVRLSGVDVKKATAHNAKFIHDNMIDVGAIIKVTRSGDVIPYIMEVVKPAKTWGAPDGKEGEDWEWNESGVDIVAITDEDGASDTAVIRQITHFFVTMEVDGFGGGTAANLHKAGLDDIASIIEAKPASYAGILGPNNAQKLGASIKERLTHVYPATLAVAWGGFGRGIGSTILWKAWNYFGNKAMEVMAKRNQKAVIENSMIAEAKLGPVAAKAIGENLKPFYAFAKTLPCKLIEYEPEEVHQVSSKLKGQGIGFTGIRDKNLEADIIKNGGTVTNGVTKETTVLILADPDSTSTKAKAARAKGLDLYTPMGFRKKYKL